MRTSTHLSNLHFQLIFPVDVLCNVILFVSPVEVCRNLVLICSYFYRCSRNEKIWTLFLKIFFGKILDFQQLAPTRPQISELFPSLTSGHLFDDLVHTSHSAYKAFWTIAWSACSSCSVRFVSRLPQIKPTVCPACKEMHCLNCRCPNVCLICLDHFTSPDKATVTCGQCAKKVHYACNAEMSLMAECEACGFLSCHLCLYVVACDCGYMGCVSSCRNSTNPMQSDCNKIENCVLEGVICFECHSGMGCTTCPSSIVVN